MKNIFLIILLLFPLLILKAQKESFEIRKGNKEYNKGAYGEAELHYRNALEKKPDSDKANYNLGNTLYKQNQFEPAITKYEILAAKETDKKKLATYQYNLGNAYFKSQKLDKSIEAYKQCLKINPSDADAKHNLLLAKQLQQQQQQQNQDQNNQDQKNKDDQQKKQDQQNQDQQKQEDTKDQQKGDQEQQISKQDAERLLEAMEQDEKNVMKKVQEQKAHVRKIPVDKEW